MKMMANNFFKRSITLLLALVMVLSTFLVSCGNSDGDNAEVVYAEAYRFNKDKARGDTVEEADLDLVSVPADDLPEGIVLEKSDYSGKYVKADICAGEYLIKDKLSIRKDVAMGLVSSDGNAQNGNDAYVVVTDHIKKQYVDISDDLQKLIDDNPGSTIYFPDGEYYLSKPVLTSADPAKSVTIMCGTFAKFMPKDWSAGRMQCMFRLGAKDSDYRYSISQLSSKHGFIGGILNGQKEASGISVEGGSNTLLHNISMKNVPIGINIATDHTDVDNVVITGTDTPDSIGVIVNGSYNTLTNMRIFLIRVGIKLLKGQNVLNTLHPLGGSAASDVLDSIGFWDLSEGNFYQICYPDHFAIGFLMEEGTASVYNGCFAYWWRDTAQQYAFASRGRFDSVIHNTRVDLNYSAADSTYIKIGAPGGKGIISYPLNASRRNDDYRNDWLPYLEGKEIN